MITTTTLKVSTHGNCDIIDITEQVNAVLKQYPHRHGTVILFHVGSTGALTTVEYEPGLVKHDIAAMFERIAPKGATYEHEKTWHDDNGHSHARASLLGPSLAIPVIDGEMTLGTWQQIILVDFDTRPRTRKVICQLIAE